MKDTKDIKPPESRRLLDRLVSVLERLTIAIERLEDPENKKSREEKERYEKRVDDIKRADVFCEFAKGKGLSVRAANVLSGDLIYSVDQINAERLRMARNCGSKTIQEILEWVARVREF